MKKLIILLAVAISLWACSDSDEAHQAAAAKMATSTSSNFQLTAAQQETYARTCQLCHGVLGTGAPAPLDTVAWEPRVAQGMEVLMDHTINGTGGMPPMGMCMECSQEDFQAFIQFMTGLECEE